MKSLGKTLSDHRVGVFFTPAKIASIAKVVEKEQVLTKDLRKVAGFFDQLHEALVNKRIDLVSNLDKSYVGATDRLADELQTMIKFVTDNKDVVAAIKAVKSIVDSKLTEFDPADAFGLSKKD